MRSKIPRLSLRVLGTMTVIAVECFRPALAAASETPAPVSTRPLQVIELPRQILNFQTTREDISVGAVVFSLLYWTAEDPQYLAAIRVNGQGLKSSVWRLFLKQAGKNQFELPALKIEFPSREQGGPLYLTLRVLFNEITAQNDSLFFVHPDDWGAQISYCTDESDDPSKVNGRIGANRAVTLAEFKARLGQPIGIALNRRPLGELGHYPMINDYFHELSADDLKLIEQKVRDRGERYLIGITAGKNQPVLVSVGDQDHFEISRTYEFLRKDGEWQVESVKPRKPLQVQPAP